MDETDRPRLSRRTVLQGTLAGLAVVALEGCSGGERSTTGTVPAPTPTAAPALEPTPACDDGDEPTPPQSAGPFFKPSSPQRGNLVDPGTPGTRLVLSGSVLDVSCRRVERAILDFWQADGEGEYDNEGYRLRGHLFSDGEGRFRVETVVPGQYPGRTRHLHVRVQPPGGRVLTTQLYFPGERQNARDALFRPECVMNVTDGPDVKAATFNFVVVR